MIIIDKGTTIVVTLNYDRNVEVIPVKDDVKTFLNWWRDRCSEYKAPPWKPRGVDRRIAAQLVTRHGLDRLKRLGVMFWRTNSTPLIEGEYNQHMILFQAKMSEAQRDLKEITDNRR